MAKSQADIAGPLDASREAFARHLDVYAHDADPVLVPDAALVFSGHYTRSGFDLVISRAFSSVSIHDYFRSVLPPAIHAPGGASLSGAVVSALTVSRGGEHYAQISPDAGAPKAIGRVEIVKGDATAIRNGQAITLRFGELVYKDDAVQTGAHSSLSLTFLDGTAFTLTADARMVLNDMVYDPNSTSNSSLLTLVQGSITFVAGNVAHTGDMKVDTPVATMGIRGTAVHVTIDANHGRTHFSVMREPNGRVGSYVLYDHNDPSHVLTTVSDVTQIVTMELVNGVVQFQTAPKTNVDIAQESDLTQLVYRAYQMGQTNDLRRQLEIGPNQAPGPETPQSHPGGGGSPGSSTPPNDLAPHSGPTPEGSPSPSSPSTNPTPDLIPIPNASPNPGPTANSTNGSSPDVLAVAFAVALEPANTIQLTAPAAPAVIGVGAQTLSLNLLAGVVDANANATLSLATNAAGQPTVTVGVVSGSYNPASVVYSVSQNHLTLETSQFKAVAPGGTVTLAFNYTVVDSNGSHSPQTALLTIDGGTAVSYGAPGGAIAVGSAPITITPTLVSPEGGDSFAIDPPGALLITQMGDYGYATINTQTGVVVYTPTATPGNSGTDRFTISDTDSKSVTTSTVLQFAVDGGTAATYAPQFAGAGAASLAPKLVSPEGGDSFAFSTAAGPILSLAGAHGAASIDPTSGVVAYAASVSPGVAGADTFTIADTDAKGVVTTSAVTVTADGGTAVSYAEGFATMGSVTATPRLVSPEGGDHFLFAGSAGPSTSDAGHFGAAVIDPNTGVVTYTPSASLAAGTSATDAFTITDTDALGVTTLATASFSIQGNAGLAYAPVSTGANAVTDAPILAAAPSRDTFAIASIPEHPHGVATIAADTGVITYTPTSAPAPGALADDVFQVTETDAAGGVIAASATISVDGGSAVSYADALAAGTAPFTERPNVVSPVGGDSFALVNASGDPVATETDSLGGVISMDAATGAISYSNATIYPGERASDSLTISDVDALGVKTVATATLLIDGGSAISYSPASAHGAPLTEAPALTSAEGGDRFALVDASGATSSETGRFGSASIDPATGVITYAANAARGTAGDDVFTVTDVDSHGVATTATATFAVDGGTALAYATDTVGAGVVIDVPTLISPEGGDRFALSNTSGASVREAGNFGLASIDPTTGVVTYTPSAAPGSAGEDEFTVTDTDALGATTTALARFDVDGGSDVTYPVSIAGSGSFTETPTVVSPEGGDTFAFVSSNGSQLTTREMAALGVATIDATTGAISFTSTAAPGTSGDIVLAVLDTDARGVETTTNAVIAVDGGAAISYADVVAAGVTPTADAPTIISPAGGDRFAFVSASGALSASATDGLGGTATIEAATGVIHYANPSLAPGEARQDAFTVADTDGLGVTTRATAALTVDGGSAVAYAAAVAGSAPVTLTPEVVSPEGGDSFGFAIPGGGVATTATRPNGTATIDAATGAIAFTPTNPPAPGSTAADAFTIADTDGLGATSFAQASVTVDGGTLATYVPPPVASTAPVTATPTLVSPEGGDRFAFLLPGGGEATSASGSFGSASLDATMGVVTYTPTRPAGQAGEDAFQIADADVAGVTTTAVVTFQADGGTLVSYSPASVLAGVTPTADAPTIISPAGGDRFAFVSAAGALSASATDGLGGTATIEAATGVIHYANPSLAPGEARQDAFTVADTDGLGVTTRATAALLVDGGSAFGYAAKLAGSAPVTLTPDVVSPEGGDSFGFAVPGGGVAMTATQPNGTATIDAATGAIAFTPTNPPSPGSTAANAFTIADTDALGATSFAQASVTVDGGTLATYAAVTSTGAAVVDRPDVTAPEPVASYAFATAGGASLTEKGTHGTAVISPDSGLITYTPSGVASGTDTFNVAVTDSEGVVTDATAAFVVTSLTPTISAPTSVTTSAGAAEAISGVSLAETGASSDETFTVTLSAGHGELAMSGVGSGSSLSVSGTLTQVNAELATLTDFRQTVGDDTITLNATDSLGDQAAPQSIAVTFNGLTPTISAPTSVTTSAGAAEAISGVSLAETGASSDETFTVTLSAGHGELAMSGVGSGSSLSVSGTLTQVNAELATLTDFRQTVGDDTITLNATDSLGDQAAPQSIAVTFNGLTPTISAPTSVTTSAGAAEAISGVSLAETGASSDETFTVTLSAGHGELAISGVGSGSSLSVSGTQTQVNAELATLTDFRQTVGDDTITLNATDSLGDQAAPQSVAVTFNGLTPTISAPTSVTTSAGAAEAISGVSLAETGASSDETFTVTLSAGHGELAISGVGSGSSLSVSGTLTQVNAELATLTDFRQTVGDDTITLNATDSLGDQAAPQSVAVTFNGLTPTISAPTSVTTSAGAAEAISGVSLAETGASSDETFTVTLSAGHGELAISGVGSGSSLSVSGTLTQVNAELATLTDFRQTVGDDTITLNATDSLGDQAAPQSIAVTFNGLTPTISAPTSVTTSAGAAEAISGVSLAETGASSDETFTVTLSAGHGELAISGVGSGSSLSVSGTLTQVNAELATLTDFRQTVGDDTITLNATDSLGDQAAPQSVAVTFNGLTPTISAPTSVTTSAGAAEAISGVSLAETGASSDETFTVTLSAGHGELAISGVGSGSSLSVSGTLTQVNAELATLTDFRQTVGDDTITLNATDSLGDQAAPQSVAVTFNGLTPTISAPTSVTTSAGAAEAISGVSLAETGASSDETFTVTLSAGHGELAISGVGSGSSLSVSGTQTQVNAELATLTDFRQTVGDDTITLNATDSLGDQATPQTIAVTTTSPISQPAISFITPVMATEGVASAVSTLVVSDVDTANSPTVTVYVTDSFGALSAQGAEGDGTQELMITGALADVNAALSTLTVLETRSGDDTITVAADDSLGGPSVAAKIVVVTPALSPQITTHTTVEVAVGVPTTVSGLNLAEAGASANGTLTVTVSDLSGSLTATGAAANGDHAITLSGDLSAIDAALATLTYTAPAAGGDTITLAATDSFGNSGPTTEIAVSAVPLAPVISVGVNPFNVSEGVATSIAGISLSEFGALATTNYTVTLTDSYGDLSVSAPYATVTGEGSTDLTVSGSLAYVNAALLTLTDKQNSPRNDLLTVSANDSNDTAATSRTVAVSTASVSTGPLTIVTRPSDTVGLNAQSPIYGVVIEENGLSSSQTVQVVIRSGGGLIYASGAGVTGSGTTDLVISGSLQTVQDAVYALAVLESSAGRDTLTLSASDSLGHTATAQSVIWAPNGGSYNWTGAVSSDLGTAGNWSVNNAPATSAPGNLDNANFNSASTISGALAAAQLNINAAVAINEDVTTTIGGYTLIGAGEGANTVTVSANWLDTSFVVVGQNTAGALTIEGGGVVTIEGGLTISYLSSAPGTLTIEDGGQLFTDNFVGLADNPGASAVATVDGAGSEWTSTATSFIVGDGGSSTLTISADAAVSAYNFRVGSNYSGSATETTSGTVFVETGASLTTFGFTAVGENAGATGNVTVENAGSRWTTDDAIGVGVNGGTGTVIVSDKGSVVAQGIQVGDNWNGPGSNGTVTIESGGQLTTWGGWNPIGANGGTGSVTVTGAGSSWIALSGIGLDDATSTLMASQGGVIQATQGIYPTGGAVISVDADSTIEAGSQGRAATGYLTVDPLPNNYSNLWGAGFINGNVMDLGNVYADHGVLTFNGSVSGDGYLVVGGEATLSLNGAVTVEPGTSYPGSVFGFGGWYGTLALADPGAVTSSIHDFVPGDTLDLSALAFDAGASSYIITVETGYDQLTVTEGDQSASLDIVVAAPLEDELQLGQDAAKTGTAVTFVSAPTSPFTLWSTLGNFFTTPNGAYAIGATWSRTNEAGDANPIWVASETSGTGSGAQTYNIVMAAQNALGQQQAQTQFVASTTLVDPFGPTGNLATAMVFVGANYVDSSAGVVWWQASATTSEYDLKFESFTDNIENVTGSTAAIALSGNITTLEQGVSSPTSWSLHSYSTGFILEFTTAVTSTTENVHLQAFGATGQATTSLVEAFQNVADSQFVSPGLGSDDNIYWSQSGGSAPGEYGENFNPNTGALGTPFQIISAAAFSKIYQSGGSPYLSDNDSVQFTDGVVTSNGQPAHVIQVSLLGPNLTDLGVTETIPLTIQTSEGFQTIQVYDNDTGATDYTVLAYLDAGQVRLDLFDNNGEQIGASFVVPDATSLLRLHDINGGPRFEIDYTVSDGQGGDNVVGAIYDVQAFRTVTAVNDAAGYGLYAGSPYDDVFYAGAGVNVLSGGGGNDTFDASALVTAAQGQVTVDAQGDVVLSDGAGDVDTLIGFSLIKLAGATIAIQGDTFTQTNADGSTVVSTFNIAEEPYARTVTHYDAQGERTSETYYNADGSIYFQAPATVEIAARTPVATLQGAATAVSGLAISETGAVADETFTVSLSDNSGQLSASGAGVSGVGTATLTIAGTLAEVNAALATLTVNEAEVGFDTITLNASDSFGGHSLAQLIAVTAASSLQGFFWNAGSGIWSASSGADWNPPGDDAIPSSASNVVIGTGGGGTVILAQTTSVASLTVTAGYTLNGNGYALTTAADGSIPAGAAANLSAATIGGALTIDGSATVSGVLTAGAGITANRGGVLALAGGELLGATLAGAGEFETAGGSSATLNGVTIGAGSSYTASDGATTELTGVLIDKGTIALAGGDGSNGVLNLTGAVTLSGGGVVAMSDNPAIGGAAYFEGNSQTLTNVDDLIEGAGVFGNGNIVLLNSGTVEATPDGGGVTLTLNNSGGIVNAYGGVGGLLEAAGGGELSINGITVDNAGGVISTADAESTVQILNARIEGGTLSNAAGGAMQTAGTSTLDGATAGALTLDGVFTASNSATTNIVGAIDNGGTIDLVGGGGSSGVMNLIGATSLTGILAMSDATGGGAAYLEGNGQTLTFAGTAIEGAGVIGNGSLAIVNQGVIDADTSAGVGELQLNGSGGVANSGTLEATGGGWLVVDAPLAGTGGLAVGAGSKLELGVAANEITTFAGVGGTLKLDAPASYSGEIANFAIGDTLYLAGENALSATPSASGQNTTLTVALSGGGSLSYQLVGDYSKDSFAVTHSEGDSLIAMGDPLSISVQSATLSQGSAGALSVAISETNATENEAFTVTLLDSHGMLAASTTGTGGGGAITGAGTANLVIAGTLTQVNADLATLTDTNDAATSDPVVVAASDNFGNHATTQTLPVTVNALQPEIVAPSSASLSEGDQSAIAGVGVVESGATSTETFTVTLYDNSGDLFANTSAPGGGGVIAGSGTTQLTIHGSLSQVNDDLSTLTVTSHISGDDTLTLKADDSFFNYALAQSTATVSADTWIGAAGGDWETGANWSAGVAPGAGDLAAIDLAAAPFTVTIASAAEVGELATAANITLDIATGSLTFDGAGVSSIAGPLENQGALYIANGVVEIGAVSNTGTIDIDGGVLHLAGNAVLEAGGPSTVILDEGGTLRGGTINAAAGGVEFSGGMLNGVAYEGTLTVQNSGSLYVDDGLTLENASGGAPGAMTLDYGAVVYFENTETIDHATVALNGPYDSFLLYTAYGNTSVETLTFGQNLTIDVASYGNNIYDTGADADDTIVNEGTIAIADNASLTIDPAHFVNAATATITVSSGGTLTIGGSADDIFTNEGTIAGDNATVSFRNFGAFANSGTVALVNSTVNLYGDFASVPLSAFANGDDTINIIGAMSNAGATLSIGTGTALTHLVLDGTIAGGTIQDAGGGLQFQGGMLNDVVYEGTLTVQNSGSLYVDDGLTLENASGGAPGAMTLDYGAVVYFENTETIDHATVALNGPYDSLLLYTAYGNTSVETLTFGQNLTIDVASYGNNIYDTGADADDTIVNEGTIAIADNASLTIDPAHFVNAATATITVSSGGTLTIGGSADDIFTNEGTIAGDNATVSFRNFGAFANSGTVALVNSTVNLYGDFASVPLSAFANGDDTINIIGAMSNAGATLSIGTGTALTHLVLDGTIAGGTIQDAGGGLQFQGGMLNDVVYEGTLTVQNSGSLYVDDGLTLENASGGAPGAMTLDYGAVVYFENTETIDHATVALNGPYDSLLLYTAYGNTSVETLTFGQNLTIDVASYGNNIYDTGADADDTIVNEGTIAIADDASLTIDPAHFVNAATATITVSSGGTLTIGGSADDAFTNEGTITVTGAIKLGEELAGSGTVIIGNGGALSLEHGADATQKVEFAAANGTLRIGSGGLDAVVSGMSAPGDVLEIVGFSAANTSLTSNTENGLTTLKATDAQLGETVVIHLGEDHSNSTWNVQEASDGSGVDIFDPSAHTSVTAGRTSLNHPPAADDLFAGGAARDSFVFKSELGKTPAAVAPSEPTSNPAVSLDDAAFHFGAYQSLLAAHADGETVEAGAQFHTLDGLHHAEMHAGLLL